MIIELLFYIITPVINLLGYIFPGAGQVPLLLPWGMDSIVTTGFNGFKILAQTFPPFNTILIAFGIYLTFRIGLRLLRAIPFFGRTIE